MLSLKLNVFSSRFSRNKSCPYLRPEQSRLNSGSSGPVSHPGYLLQAFCRVTHCIMQPLIIWVTVCSAVGRRENAGSGSWQLSPSSTNRDPSQSDWFCMITGWSSSWDPYSTSPWTPSGRCRCSWSEPLRGVGGVLQGCLAGGADGASKGKASLYFGMCFIF